MILPAPQQLNLWNVGRQALTVSPDGGRIVTDTGLLAVRDLDKQLGILADLAARLPDPRAPLFIVHSKEALLTQSVYQILAGYADFQDSDSLRHDPLFQILADVSPDAEQPLASGSTQARFQYAYTRRRPKDGEPDIDVQRRAAQTQRIRLLNEFLLDLFIRTRRTPPPEIILDVDATDDPVHGQQHLSGYHGYYQQHQYLPLLIFEGSTGFPLAAWLRPGRVHGGCGAVDIVAAVVARLRAAWPNVVIKLRSDNALALPELYDYAERENLPYAFGYASNAVLERRTAWDLECLQTYQHWYQHREPAVQAFVELRDYQAATWSRPRRIVVKLEVTPQGSQRRYVVTNMAEPAAWVYRDFYVQRGAVPEQPIGELKNGLQADRLSAHGFCANAYRLLVHTVAYALVVLWREACRALPEVATASVSTLRHRLWKVGALLVSSGRRLWLRLSETWPGWDVWVRVQEAVRGYVGEVQQAAAARAAVEGSQGM
jgi:hypothetical protein